MENYVAGQLAALGTAVALGAAGGLVYDLLRVLRRSLPGAGLVCVLLAGCAAWLVSLWTARRTCRAWLLFSGVTLALLCFV